MRDAAVPDLTLERYRLGELPEAEMRGLRQALERDPGLRERLAALEQSDQEVLARHPPSTFAAAVERRLDGERRPLLRLVPAWAVPLTLAVVVAGLLVWQDPMRGPTPTGDRLKGGTPGLLLFRKAGSQAERLEAGAVARPRDVVQVAYQAGGHRYGVILSIDGRGAVTRHLPVSGESAAALRPSGPTVLEAAYRLDDAPRLERFYFVAADAPFEVPVVLAAAGSPGLDPLLADRLPLETSFVQTSFLLRKE